VILTRSLRQILWRRSHPIATVTPMATPSSVSAQRSSRTPSHRTASQWVAAVTTAVLATSASSCSTPDTSLADAYAFLDLAMDTCGRGDQLRLPPSYLSGVPAADSPDASYVYDVAVTTIAYTARGTDEDLARARTLAASLVALQTSDPAGDGRLRNAYPCTAPAGSTQALTDTTSTGNMAWTGLALLQVHATDDDAATLEAAVRLGTWVHETTADDRGTGGYTGGLDADGSAFRWKSTEHNLDVAAFFLMLASATGDPVWSERAESAMATVTALQDPASGHYWVGTGTDGTTPNTDDYVPEDVQSWASLVLPGDATSRALDWAAVNLVVGPDGARGAKVGDGPDATETVWLEGTAHLACALRVRGLDRDAALADELLDTLRDAQRAPETPGDDSPAADDRPDDQPRGIPAASQDGTAGGDSTIYDALHTGTTAWFVLALQGSDPFSDDGRT
jgi:hypothetical protein